jgi:Lar family restriction alleviation protein
MTVDLLPCPFCGREAEIERIGDARRSTIYACTNCGCSLETGEEWDHGNDWNRRADPAPSNQQPSGGKRHETGDDMNRKAQEAAAMSDRVERVAVALCRSIGGEDPYGMTLAPYQKSWQDPEWFRWQYYTEHAEAAIRAYEDR